MSSSTDETSVTETSDNGGVKNKKDCCSKYADYTIRTEMGLDSTGDSVMVVNCYCGHCGSLILKTDCRNKQRGRETASKGTSSQKSSGSATETRANRAGQSFERLVTRGKFFSRLRLKRNRLERSQQPRCSVCGVELKGDNDNERRICEICEICEIGRRTTQNGQVSPLSAEQKDDVVGSACSSGVTPVANVSEGKLSDKLLPSASTQKKIPDPKLLEPVVYQDPNVKKLSSKKKLKNSKSKASLNSTVVASPCDERLGAGVRKGNGIRAEAGSDISEPSQVLYELHQCEAHCLLTNNVAEDLNDERETDAQHHSTTPETTGVRPQCATEFEGNSKINAEHLNTATEGNGSTDPSKVLPANEIPDSAETVDIEIQSDDIQHRSAEETTSSDNESSAKKTIGIVSSGTDIEQMGSNDETVPNVQVFESVDNVDRGLQRCTDQEASSGMYSQDGEGANLVNDEPGSDDTNDGLSCPVYAGDGDDQDDCEDSIYNNQSIYDTYRSDVDDDLCESQQHLKAETINNPPEVELTDPGRTIATIGGHVIVSSYGNAVSSDTVMMSGETGSEEHMKDSGNPDMKTEKKDMTAQDTTGDISSLEDKSSSSCSIEAKAPHIVEDSIVHVPNARKLRRNSSRTDMPNRVNAKSSASIPPLIPPTTVIIPENVPEPDERKLGRERLYDIAIALDSMDPEKELANNEIGECDEVVRHTCDARKVPDAGHDERSAYLEALHDDAMSGVITREPNSTGEECERRMCNEQCRGDPHCSCEQQSSSGKQCCDDDFIRREPCICSDYIRCNEHSLYETHDVCEKYGGYSRHSVYSQHTVYADGTENIYDEQSIYDVYTAYDTDDDSIEKHLSITYMEKKLRKKNRYFFLDNVHNVTPAEKGSDRTLLRLFRGNPIC